MARHSVFLIRAIGALLLMGWLTLVCLTSTQSNSDLDIGKPLSSTFSSLNMVSMGVVRGTGDFACFFIGIPINVSCLGDTVVTARADEKSERQRPLALLKCVYGEHLATLQALESYPSRNYCVRLEVEAPEHSKPAHGHSGAVVTTYTSPIVFERLYMGL